MSLFNGVNDKFHVLEVLKLDQDETQKLYEKLKELGVEQKKDLQYVEARDLFPVLNLVQARKLKKCWDEGECFYVVFRALHQDHIQSWALGKWVIKGKNGL